MCPLGLWNGCVPAMLASLYVNIPWSHHLTFSAAPGAFREAWNHADILSRLERQFGDRCVWLLVFAVQPGTGEPHAHVLLAGVTDRAVIRQVDRWRRLGFHGHISRVSGRAGGRWRVLHYILSPTTVPLPVPEEQMTKEQRDAYVLAKKFAHKADVNSYTYAMIEPPRESANLDALLALIDHRIRRTREIRGQRSAAGLSPSARVARARNAALSLSPVARSERARKAARARWDRNPVKP